VLFVQQTAAVTLVVTDALEAVQKLIELPSPLNNNAHQPLAEP
jgi:hypothetical protein